MGNYCNDHKTIDLDGVVAIHRQYNKSLFVDGASAVDGGAAAVVHARSVAAAAAAEM